MKKKLPQPPSEPPARKQSTQARPPAVVTGKRFPIVGISASAGGLEAFKDLLGHLPSDTGMGSVLVQHLDPEHESALTELLSRVTPMHVMEVKNNQRVEQDHIYVIPPNTCMALAGGVLKLTPRDMASGAARSIDFFFDSLAKEQKERAIGAYYRARRPMGPKGWRPSRRRPA